MRAITYGHRGEDVRDLQWKLTQLGYDTKGVDGICGTGTLAAIRKFQADNLLVVDGWAGNLTKTRLNDKLNKVSGTKYKMIRRFGTNIWYYVTDGKEHADITLGEYGKLETVRDVVKGEIKKGKDVVMAINAGFFIFGGREHLGMLIDEGLYYHQPSGNFVDFIFYKDGHTEVKNLDAYDKKVLSDLQRDAHWAIGTSYSLIVKGKKLLMNTGKFSHSTSYQPRSMFGSRLDGRFVLAVADGRSKVSRGLTAQQQYSVMAELGCYNAVNCDGGGSSTFVWVVNGIPVVINKPSGGERRVGSVMTVLR